MAALLVKESKAVARTGISKASLLSLRSEIVLGIIVSSAMILTFVILVDTFGIPFTSYKGSYGSEKEDALRFLSLVADSKRERLESWLNEARGDISMLAEGASIKRLENRLQTQDEVYAHVAKRFDELIKTSHRYRKIHLVGSEAGRIMISSQHAAAAGTARNLRSFQKALQTPDEVNLEVEIDPSDQKTYVILAKAVSLDDDRCEAKSTDRLIILAYIDMEKLLRPMLYVGEGMGQSGEILLVSQDTRALMSLKYPLADGSIATPLEYQIGAMPSLLAAQGKDGMIETEDYRGIPVIAAHRFVRISQDQGWGMVVKQDRSEIFAPLWSRILYTSVIGLIGILAAGALALRIGRGISKPIDSLAETAQEVASGNLEVRARIYGSPETRTLAHTFNSMMDRVRERTEDLEQTNRELSTQIEQRKETEEKLRAALVDLSLTNKELSQFAYVSSHDLQEPLRNVAQCAQLLDRKYGAKLGPEGDQLIRYAVQASARSIKLIQDLLSYSRVGTNGMPFEPMETEEILDLCLSDLRTSIEESGARISHDSLPEITADKIQIHLLFLNLISNAIKFRGSAPPEIHVSAEKADGFWNFCVRDNGVGIKEEYFDRIFVIFQRLHREEKYPGTGIGLAIAKKIVERHGGKIEVKSTVGEGSEFCFTIPMTKVLDRPENKPEYGGWGREES